MTNACARPLLAASALLALGACASTRTVDPVLGSLRPSLAFDLGRDCPDSAPTALAPIAPSDSLAQLPLGPSADDNVRGAWVARRAPGGWGGAVFYQRIGRDPAFYLKRPAARDSLLTALAQWPEAKVPLEMVRQATVLPARWDFAELYDWSRYLEPKLQRDFGVQEWDMQEATNRIEIGIAEKQPEQVGRIAQRLRELDVPCHLIRYRLVGPSVLISRSGS